MFPVAISIATVAMMAGIGGIILFAPFFMLGLEIAPLIALGSGLVIEFFGFSSGVIGYRRKREIDFYIVNVIVIFTVPATKAGVFIGRIVPGSILQIMLVLLLCYLAYQFLFAGKECQPKDPRCTGITGIGGKQIVTRTIRLTSLLVGLMVGMISAGLGEMNELNFLKRVVICILYKTTFSCVHLAYLLVDSLYVTKVA